MLIEQAAYGNRWRQVCPAAKGSFALAGLLAAFLAHSPQNALGVALLLAMATLWGARVTARFYLHAALPAIGFLLLSCFGLFISIRFDATGMPAWHFAPEVLPQVETIAARSLAAMAALLGLVLTTPLPDLIGLLRRLKTPEVLLDLMVLCYRMLFVFASATEDIRQAQQARNGYSTHRRSLHSLGQLTANLALQIWLRARALQQAVLARNGDGPLRFLTPAHPHAMRDQGIALLAGTSLIMAAWRLGA